MNWAAVSIAATSVRVEWRALVCWWRLVFVIMTVTVRG